MKVLKVARHKVGIVLGMQTRYSSVLESQNNDAHKHVSTGSSVAKLQQL